MKQDIELFRIIMKKIEDAPAGKAFSIKSPPEYDEATFYEHVNLLSEAGLIEAKPLRGDGKILDFMVKGMTMEGHEFFKLAKNDSLWKKAVDKALAIGGTITVGSFYEVLKNLALKHIGLP